MEALQGLIDGFGIALTWHNLLWALINTKEFVFNQ